MKTVTADAVTETLKRIVEEKGEDYIYQPFTGGQCYYADPVSGEPSCIVGHLLEELDSDGFRAVREREHFNGTFDAIEAVEEAGLDVPGYVREALQIAQNTQDNCYSWGEAFDRYLARLEEEHYRA
jgi:hypothetical protein